tara:strand:- start:6365 stop:6646 length:282 start_codon:yes stop_codon:yes gene_type:complete
MARAGETVKIKCSPKKRRVTVEMMIVTGFSMRLQVDANVTKKANKHLVTEAPKIRSTKARAKQAFVPAKKSAMHCTGVSVSVTSHHAQKSVTA